MKLHEHPQSESPHVTLESLGVSDELQPDLNMLGAPVRVGKRREWGGGELFFAAIDRPLSGVLLSSLLNAVTITYPGHARKYTVSPSAIAADHVLPSQSHLWDAPENQYLHKIHTQDPAIGTIYTDFARHHAKRWLQAERNYSLESVWRLAHQLVQRPEASLTGGLYELDDEYMSYLQIRVDESRDQIVLTHEPSGAGIVLDTNGGSFVANLFVESASGHAVPWKLHTVVVPHYMSREFITPVLAWRKKDGKRSFISQSEAGWAARGYDVFLGRSVLAYLSPQITSQFTAWHMKLKNTETGQLSKFQDMAAAQIPVWVSLKQHEAKLLSDENPVVAAIEQSLA